MFRDGSTPDFSLKLHFSALYDFTSIILLRIKYFARIRGLKKMTSLEFRELK